MEVVRANPVWGEERIAAELLRKLGVRVSSRTVRRYMGRGLGGRGPGATGPRSAAFVGTHAHALVAGVFGVAGTATFRVLHIFVALEVGSRRLLHVNVTGHPTAAWTLQQFREVLAAPHAYRFILHDRDSIYSPWLDAAGSAMGIRVLRTPVQAPRANAVYERLLGSRRRACVDFLIPFGENHLRRILRAWQAHGNRGRPHASLGQGLPSHHPGCRAPDYGPPATARRAGRGTIDPRWAPS